MEEIKDTYLQQSPEVSLIEVTLTHFASLCSTGEADRGGVCRDPQGKTKHRLSVIC